MTVPTGDLLNIVAYRAVAISPDGRRVVYRSSSGLYLRDMENLEPRMIPGTEQASSPFFSPDGRWLAFFAEGKLKKVALSGGAPVTLAEAPDNRGGTWSRDGTIIFSASTIEGLSRVSESGGPGRGADHQRYFTHGTHASMAVSLPGRQGGALYRRIDG